MQWVAAPTGHRAQASQSVLHSPLFSCGTCQSEAAGARANQQVMMVWSSRPLSAYVGDRSQCLRSGAARTATDGQSCEVDRQQPCTSHYCTYATPSRPFDQCVACCFFRTQIMHACDKALSGHVHINFSIFEFWTPVQYHQSTFYSSIVCIQFNRLSSTLLSFFST
jgi:hypothetical protein